MNRCTWRQILQERWTPAAVEKAGCSQLQKEKKKIARTVVSGKREGKVRPPQTLYI
jgi:hypothetical protein